MVYELCMNYSVLPVCTSYFLLQSFLSKLGLMASQRWFSCPGAIEKKKTNIKKPVKIKIKPSLTMMAGSLIGLQLIWFLNRLLTILFLFWIVFNVAVLKTIQIINKKMSNRFKIRQLLHQLQAFCDPKSLSKRVWMSY